MATPTYCARIEEQIRTDEKITDAVWRAAAKIVLVAEVMSEYDPVEDRDCRVLELDIDGILVLKAVAKILRPLLERWGPNDPQQIEDRGWPWPINLPPEIDRMRRRKRSKQRK